MVTADEPLALGQRALVYLVNLRWKLSKIAGISKADFFFFFIEAFYERPEAFSCQNRGFMKAKLYKVLQ